jgi:glycosyltransferase involved in cell wall biosynthesis
VSPWLQERAAASPILKGKKHRVILNGLDAKVFCPRPFTPQLSGADDHFRAGTVFHATAMFRDHPEDHKGGWYIVRLAERLRKDGIRFIVAGKHEINGRLPDNVILLGPVRDQNRMAEYYSGADVTVISSRRETFSMVCAESLCCGTPVAGFRAGGPETISLPEYSRFCKYGDLDALEKCVRELLKDGNNADRAAKIAERAAIIYDRERMADRYIEIYRQLMGEK